jgi:GWxTD domain-containing protein
MRVSGFRNRLGLVLLSFLLCVPLSSARGQDQNPAAKRSKDPFKVFADSPTHKWLDEDVRWIISDQERADFSKITTVEQRDEFVEAFWERRNPTPSATENKFKEEHYRRLAFANTHFGSGVPGWKTDRGRIYIVYGSPDEIERHPGSPGQYPSEVWRYKIMKGIGLDVPVEFVDTCQCDEYHLTVDWSEKLTPVHKD